MKLHSVSALRCFTLAAAGPGSPGIYWERTNGQAHRDRPQQEQRRVKQWTKQQAQIGYGLGMDLGFSFTKCTEVQMAQETTTPTAAFKTNPKMFN